jgi:hypothetical protein
LFYSDDDDLLNNAQKILSITEKKMS